MSGMNQKHALWGAGVVAALGVLAYFSFATDDKTPSLALEEVVDEAKVEKAEVEHRRRRSGVTTKSLDADDETADPTRAANEFYRFQPVENGFAITNRTHQLDATFDDEGRTSIHAQRKRDGKPSTKRVSFKTKSLGHAGSHYPLERPTVVLGKCSRDSFVGEEGECIPRLEMQREGVTEWWVNDSRGLEHGYTISHRLADEGPIQVEIEVEGADIAIEEHGGSAEFVSNGEPLLRYAGLVAMDATGRALPSKMRATDNLLALVVDDKNAEYPIMIDPIVTPAAWSVEINIAGAEFGASVAVAGDINGDGNSDVLIGAPGIDEGANTDVGRAYIVLGDSDMSAVDHTFNPPTPQANARFGEYVTSIGDVNADGVADFAVGVPKWDGAAGVDSGAVFIWYGGNTNANTPSVTLEGSQAGENFGHRIGFGDIENDGDSDIVVGAPLYDGMAGTDCGRAYVFKGDAAGLPTTPFWSFEGDDAGGQFGHGVAISFTESSSYIRVSEAGIWVSAPFGDCASLSGVDCTPAGGSGENGYIRVFSPQPDGSIPTTSVLKVGRIGERRGMDLRATGILGGTYYDTQSDGHSGWVLSRSGAWDNAGTRYSAIDSLNLFYTRFNAGTVPRTGPYFHFSSDANEEFAASFAPAGDIDGNDIIDLLAGAPGYDVGGNVDAGRVYLNQTYRFTDGKTPSVWQAALQGDQAGARFGAAVSSAGDINADGLSDIAIGAPNYDNGQTDEGRVFIHLGFSKSLPNLAPASNYHYWAGNPDIGLGDSISNADLNGDGYQDAIAGAPRSGSGEVFIWRGGFTVERLETPQNTPPTIWRRSGSGSTTNARFGASVAGAGDINGDGYDDVVVGAPDHSEGESNEGAFYVFYGSASGPEAAASTKVQGGAINRHLGESVAGVGDVNGDGFADVAVGAPSEANGNVYVYLGSASGLSTNVLAGFAFNGTQAGSRCGAAISPAGDRNADGFADIAIGCPRYDGSGLTDSGIIFVVNGGENGLGASNSYEGMMSCATRNNLFFGSSIAFGSVNADALPDLIVGAPGTSCGNSNEGGALVIPTAVGGGFGSPLTPFEGGVDNANFGLSVSLIDLDGDGQSAMSMGGVGVEPIVRETKSSGAALTAGSFRADGLSSPTAGRRYNAINVGDMNADGFEDIIGQTSFQNFNGNGLTMRFGGYAFENRLSQPTGGAPVLQISDASRRIGRAGGSDVANGFRTYWAGTPSRSLRDRVRLQVQAVPVGSEWSSSAPVFVNASATQIEAFGSAGVTSDASLLGITSPLEDTAYRVRARVVYSPNAQVTSPYTKWRYFTTTVEGAMRTATCPGNFAIGVSGQCDACDADWYGAGCNVQCRDAVECGGVGTCQNDGSCSCNAGFAGASCQYSDAVTCNGNGTVDNAGACSCSAGWLGAGCQYSDATTCNSHGTVDSAGVCSCATGFDGAACDACAAGYFNYPSCVACNAATTCNGNGVCQPDGSCSCSAGFDGAGCNACASDYYNYPSCTFCQAATTCSGNGTCAAGGGCACGAGWLGNACQYSDATTCNGRGTVDNSGNCACSANFSGNSCEQCAAGRAGPNCEYSDATTCNSRGVAQNDGSCVCNSGFAGANCELDSDGRCNGNGSIQPDASCACNSGYAGEFCDSCAANYFNYPGCVFCEAATTCNSNGSCDANGACVCVARSAGNECQYTDALTCSGNGVAQNDGSCACAVGFTGARCDTCDAGFFGPSCSCTNSGTCNDNGTCNAGGTCDCGAGFGGAACDECASGFVGFPNCVPCDDQLNCRGVGTCNASGGCDCPEGFTGSRCQYSRRTTCSNHGTPDESGNCACDSGFAGVSCNQCASGFQDYPNCRFCDAAVTCGGNGACDGAGECVCNAGFAGPVCEYSRSATCSGNGNPNADGTCVCDRGFGGATCSLSRADCSENGDPQSSGACLCDVGFGGESCEFDVTRCNGAGMVRSDGSCVCSQAFAGDTCDACDIDYYEYPTCRRCVDSQCLGHGTCDDRGFCDCEMGYAGEFCQHSDAVTCSGHGVAQADGSCVCAEGHAGARCQFSDAEWCDGRGVARDDGQCDCQAEYAGKRCEYVVAEVCIGPGRVANSGDCICDEGYAGEGCAQCAPYYFGFPNCQRCNDETTCSGNGTCTEAGGCACDENAFGPAFVGANCQYANDGSECGNAGRVQEDGSCICPESRYYAGERCQYNTWTTCNGAGWPKDDGTCDCIEELDVAGANCQYSRAKTCSGNGSPTDWGGCECDLFTYDTPDCKLDACPEGQYGFGCQACDEATDCGGFPDDREGRIAQDGVCVGTADYRLSDNGALCHCPPGTQDYNCRECPAGHACPGGVPTLDEEEGRIDYHRAQPCPIGSMAPKNSAECSECPENYWSPGGAGFSDQCHACDCNDNNPCTVDTCDRGTGECTFTETEGCMLCGNGTCDTEVRVQRTRSDGTTYWELSGEAEDCNTCATDCGVCPVCGDDQCTPDAAFDRERRRVVPGETCWSCAIDCDTCVYPEANLPGFVPPTPPAPGVRPEPNPERMCSGTPNFSGTLPIGIDLSAIQLSTSGVGGKGFGVRGYGGISYSHAWNVNQQLCQWDGSGNMGLNACVGNQCTALDITGAAICTREPVCSDFGYDCELGDPYSADCSAAIEVALRRGWEIGVGGDFGPFYAEINASVYGQLAVRGTAFWGEMSNCRNTEYSGLVSATGKVSGTAGVGIRVGGVSAGVNVTASGCMGAGYEGRTGCGDTSGFVTGAKAELRVPSVDLILDEIGPWVYEWSEGRADICL